MATKSLGVFNLGRGFYLIAYFRIIRLTDKIFIVLN